MLAAAAVVTVRERREEEKNEINMRLLKKKIHNYIVYLRGLLEEEIKRRKEDK